MPPGALTKSVTKTKGERTDGQKTNPHVIILTLLITR